MFFSNGPVVDLYRVERKRLKTDAPNIVAARALKARDRELGQLYKEKLRELGVRIVESRNKGVAEAQLKQLQPLMPEGVELEVITFRYL